MTAKQNKDKKEPDYEIIEFQKKSYNFFTVSIDFNKKRIKSKILRKIKIASLYLKILYLNIKTIIKKIHIFFYKIWLRYSKFCYKIGENYGI